MTESYLIRYIGMCDECYSVKSFDTQAQRDLWEKYHAHDEGH